MVTMIERETLPVAEARTGSSEAWDALFRRYQAPLFAFVFELVRQREASLDIVQETFINAVRYLDRLRDDDKFGSWLFGIAHQKCVQRWRRSGIEPVAGDELPEPAAEAAFDPRAELIRKEQSEQFFAALERLSPPHRAVLLLHFLEDFPLEDIARATQTTVGTVKSRIHYAKRALRRLLQETP